VHVGLTNTSDIVLSYCFMNNQISEDIVRSITEALSLHAPDLLPTITKLVSSAVYQKPALIPGSSIHGTYSASISKDESEPILRLLEVLEHDLGYQTVFANRQINYLVAEWRRFSKL
jgi:hypothetical protein